MAESDLTGTPLVSICIANYNGAGMIAGCLDSVLAQRADCHFEILVHDDASTDASADLVSQQYPQVRLLRSASNVGFCIANNRMVAMARGAYVLLLNNDAELLPDALSSLVGEAGRQTDQALLTLAQYDYDSGALIDRGCLLDPFYNPVPNLDSTRQDVAMAIGACLWVPRSLWEKFGGFPECFGSIGEDLYLCCRARLAGHPVRVLDVSGYRHRVGRSFGGGKPAAGRLLTTFRRRALSERNKTFVLLTTCPMPQLLLLLPIHLCLLLLEGFTLALIKRSTGYLTTIYLPVFRALWQQRKSLLQLRQQCLGDRRAGARGFFSAFVSWPYKLRMLFRHGLPTVK